MYQEMETRNDLESRNDERNEHQEYRQDAWDAATEYNRKNAGRRVQCDRCGEFGIVGTDVFAVSYMIGFADFELEIRHRYDCQSERAQYILMYAYASWMRDLNDLCDQMESGRMERCEKCGARIMPGIDSDLEIHVYENHSDVDGAETPCPSVSVEYWCMDRVACEGRYALHERGF